MPEDTKQFKKLIIRGKSAVFVDWANVYGWEKTLKHEINPEKIYSYLKEYEQINQIIFYFGTDKHEKSIQFIDKVRKIGYQVVTKPVKYILADQIDNPQIWIRKCDFDMEVCIDTHRLLKNGLESFIFFTGDGDYAPLYQMLIELKKQVIVIYTSGHLGREIWDIKRGLFKIQLKNLMEL